MTTKKTKAPGLMELVTMPADVIDLPAPDNGPYIVAAKDGYYGHRTFHFGRVLVPTPEAPLLPETKPTLWFSETSKVPARVIGQAYSFFKAIYEDRKSEAMVDITWNAEQGYRLFVPPQRASGGGVQATRNLEHYKGQIVGTMHSHCNFSAFHSGTDNHDADSHDGLHITIGDVMKASPSIAIMISVGKIKWAMTLEEISDGPLKLTDHPKWWERFVADPLPGNSGHVSSWGSNSKKPATSSGGSTYQSIPRASGVSSPPGTKGWTPPTARGSTFSIAEFLWRYEHALQADDVMLLGAVEQELDIIRETLNDLGIEMDTEFATTLPVGTWFTDDDGDPDAPTPDGAITDVEQLRQRREADRTRGLM